MSTKNLTFAIEFSDVNADALHYVCCLSYKLIASVFWGKKKNIKQNNKKQKKENNKTTHLISQKAIWDLYIMVLILFTAVPVTEHRPLCPVNFETARFFIW